MALTTAELAEKLAKLPASGRAAILGAVVVVLIGIYYYIGFPGLLPSYTDLVAQREEVVAAKGRLLDEERNLQQRLADLNELLRQKAEVEESLRKNAVRLPASSELPAFFQHLQTQAAAAKVILANLTREKEVGMDGYIKVPVRLDIRGTFLQIVEYFKLLSETPRIISVEDLSLSPMGGDRLAARFMASTFRQPDRPPSAAPPPPAPAPAPSVAASPPSGRGAMILTPTPSSIPPEKPPAAGGGAPSAQPGPGAPAPRGKP